MKKWLALVVAALLALSTMAAFAATPSKTTSDLAKIDAASIETSTGVAVADDFVIAIPAEDPAKVTEVVEGLYEDTTKGGKPVIAYFDDETADAIADLLPAGVNLEELELNELISLVIENYDEAYGDIDIVFYFNTQYKPEPDQYLVAVLGNYSADKAAQVEAEDGVEWTALEAEGQDDGGVKVTFTQDALIAAEEAEVSMLGILSTPVAAQEK